MSAANCSTARRPPPCRVAARPASDRRSHGPLRIARPGNAACERNTGGRPACCRAATVNGELSVLSDYLMVVFCVFVPPLVDLTVTDGDEPTLLVTRSFQAPSVSTACGVPICVPAAL